MNSSKRKIIIGGIVAVLGIALLAYVAHVLTAALDSKPGDVSKAQFVVQLGADEKLTNAAADRTLTLDFGEPFTHAPTGRTLPQLVTVTDVYHLKDTGSKKLSCRVFFPVNYLRSDDERVSITLDGKATGRWYGVGEQPFACSSSSRLRTAAPLDPTSKAANTTKRRWKTPHIPARALPIMSLSLRSRPVRAPS